MTTSRVQLLTALALAGTGIVHIQQWFAGYRDVSTTGPMFLLQGAAALALIVWLYASKRDLVAPIATAALMAASLVALGMAYFGGFINLVEVQLRPATVISIVTEVVALVGALIIVARRNEGRIHLPVEEERPRNVPRPTPDVPVMLDAFHRR